MNEFELESLTQGRLDSVRKHWLRDIDPFIMCDISNEDTLHCIDSKFLQQKAEQHVITKDL